MYNWYISSKYHTHYIRCPHLNRPLSWIDPTILRNKLICPIHYIATQYQLYIKIVSTNWELVQKRVSNSCSSQNRLDHTQLIYCIKSVFTVYLGFILTQPFVYIFMFNSVSPIQLGHYHHLGMWSWPNQFWQCCSQIIIQIGANNYTVVRSRYSKRRCLAILLGPFHK